MRTFTLCLVAAITLTACVSTGRKVDMSELQSFTVGQTTVADVEGKLGNPNFQTVSSEGFTTLVYSYTHAQARAESFIPIAGAFVGGADCETQSVVFIFGADGKLKSYNQSSGQNNVGTGLASGAAQ